MRAIVFSVTLTSLFLGNFAESFEKYWIIEENFFKLGKKELYEEEKKKSLDFKKFEKVISLEDLENPQYVFFTPVKDLSSLAIYPPFQEKELPVLSSCLHFSIFSLHKWLEKASFRIDQVFLKTRPYVSYVLYDITPGSQKLFEEHLQRIALKQSSQSSRAWGSWKVLIGADTPKYLLCASFKTKEELKDADLQELWEEMVVKDIVRDKKSGWMKISDAFSRK